MASMKVTQREASNSAPSYPLRRAAPIGDIVFDIERRRVQDQVSDSVTRKGVSKYGGST